MTIHYSVKSTRIHGHVQCRLCRCVCLRVQECELITGLIGESTNLHVVGSLYVYVRMHACFACVFACISTSTTRCSNFPIDAPRRIHHAVKSTRSGKSVNARMRVFACARALKPRLQTGFVASLQMLLGESTTLSSLHVVGSLTRGAIATIISFLELLPALGIPL